MANSTKRKRPRSLSEWVNATTENFEYLFHRLIEGVGQVFSGIGALFFPRRLVNWWRKRNAERAAKGITQESSVGKSVEKFEDRFHVAMQGVGSTFGDIFKLFIPSKLIESTEKAVTTKTTSVFWDLRYRFRKLVERITPKWLQKVLERLYGRFAFLFKFTGAWTKTRNYKALAWSLPAFLFAIPIAASLAGSVVYSSQAKIGHYNNRMRDAIEERNASVEQLCAKKLEQLGYTQLDLAKYTAAIALARDGDWDQAIADMQAIAPLEKAGLAPAHLWLATQIAEGRLVVDDPWADFKTHAEHAQAQSFGRYRALRKTAERFKVEADLYYGRNDEAFTVRMLELVDDFPELNAHLMENAYQNRDPGMMRYARETLERFESMVTPEGDTARPMNAEEFGHWALACQLLGNDEKLVNVLSRVKRQLPDDTNLQTKVEAIFERRLSQMTFRETGLATVLEKAFETDPTNRLAIARLVNGVLRKRPIAIQCLETLEANRKLPADVLIQLGDMHVSGRSYQEAVRYYQRAVVLDPTQLRAWNNMAHVLSHFEPTNYELALSAINKAIELDEEDGRIFETKGQILVKLQRWDEAIPNLEKGLNATLPDPRPTHAALALAYEKLGNTEQSVAHKAQAGM